MKALIYGKPTLVSDLPALKEVVADMQTAFLFESENSISLTEKLNFILLDSEKLEQVGRNGEKLINKKYNWNEIGKQTKLAYQTLY
jgi:glycosyltransferase involved in cell wall biosynthesis